MKKMFKLFTNILLVSTFAVGCSSSSTTPASNPDPASSQPAATVPSGETVTLKFFHRWPKDPDKSYFDQVVKEFEQANPNIKIETEAVLNDSYKEKIRVLLGTNNPPDVFTSWSGEFAYKFVRGDKVLDLTPHLQKDQAWANQLVQTQFPPFTLDGKIYGAPMTLDGKTFFYNKEIFKQLNLEVPKTWPEFIQTLQKIKDSGITPIAFGNKAPWAVSHYIGTFNQRMVDQETRMKDYNRATGTFEDPGYVEALRKLNELSPYFNKDVNALEHQFARQTFIDGKAAIGYFQKAEIGLIEPNIKFEIGFIDFPQIDGAKGNPTYLTGAPEGWMISSLTKHPEEALKFVKFLTSKEMGEKYVKDVGKLSAVQGTVHANTATPTQIEAVDRVMKAEGFSLWLDTDMDIKIVDAYLAGAQQMLAGQKTPEEVIADVQKAAAQVRTEAK
ncbi:ABC transporter substrate-binding protein [Ammoniphilus sp. YIM 78166]|uniref:ABC transporter substrate-binding protein n=1 Tax=Ammoniphilus sp. YIM 78166 TaxID=1644106 RepID=UPI00106F450F|nr:extracellular solute-binding protein [Ammoniphilus sp. YIM 78166]